MTKIDYCQRWFRAKSSPIGPLTEKEARKCHIDRSPYVAVCSDPRAFLEISDDYIGVGFLDPHGREYLSYQFQEKKAGKLFLTMATHRHFSDSSRVENGTTYLFGEDGKVIIEDSDFQTKEKRSREQEIDVSGNWEDYPEFGCFQELLKIER